MKHRETCVCGAKLKCDILAVPNIESFREKHKDCRPPDYYEENLLLKQQIKALNMSKANVFAMVGEIKDALELLQVTVGKVAKELYEGVVVERQR